MANQPCCTNDANCFCIPFTNNQQEAIFWCWAAVTANSHNAMLPAAPQMRQCDVVAKVFPAKAKTYDPCKQANKTKYKVMDIGTVLDDVNMKDGFAVGLVIGTLVTELSGAGGAAEPVIVEIDFPGPPLAIHYIVICGVHIDTQTICIADPRYGGDPVEFAFDDLSDYGYQNDVPHSGGNGVARDFQKVQRP